MTKKPVPFELFREADQLEDWPLLASPVDPERLHDMQWEDAWHRCESRYDVMYSVNIMLKELGIDAFVAMIDDDQGDGSHIRLFRGVWEGEDGSASSQG